MSTLYLRGNYVWLDYADQFGIRHRKPLGVELDRIERRDGRIVWSYDVRNLKRQFDIQFAAGKYDLGPDRTQRIPLTELLETFLEQHGHTRARGTQRLYREAVDSFVDELGDRPILSIDEDALLTWRRRLEARKLTDHTVSIKLRSLSAILSWAEDRNLVGRNPVTQYVRVNPKPLPVVLLARDEVRRLLKGAGAPDRDLFTFLLLTGFRIGEACALKWTDVDFKQRLIRVWNAKEKRWDYFPMDPDLVSHMRKLSRGYDPYVFFYRIPQSASRRFRTLRKNLRINPDVTLHTLRTNFISGLIHSRLTESEVMHLARHRSIITTHKYYGAFDQADMRKALGRSRPRRAQKKV
jgi:integrase